MVCDAVQKRRRHAFALEDLAPIAEGQVAGNHQASAFVAVGEDLEQQLRSRPAERQVTQLIHDQQIELVELVQEAVQGVVLLGFFQAIHQSRGGEELGLITRPTRGQAQSNCDMRLASARLT